MKIQLDTSTKEIVVLEPILIVELVKELKLILPDTGNEYTIVSVSSSCSGTCGGLG